MPPTSRASTHRFYPLKKQSHFVLALSLCCILAVWVAKLKPLAQTISSPFILVTISILAAIFLTSKKPRLGRLMLLLVCSLASYSKASNLVSSLKVYDQLFGKQVALTATVQDDAAYNTYGDYEFNAVDLHFAEDGRYLPGRIRIRTKQNVAVYRGDRIFVNGKINAALGARTGSISYATIEVVNSKPSGLEELRLKFFAAVYSSMPEPHASLGIGFLAGVRSSISKTLQDQLSRVGLTHIIAVSGYNLTILVMAISKLGKRLSKYQQLVISLSLIFTFLLITGFAASIVRAAIVSLISIACSFFGRKISALNTIMITAAITAVINPVYLWEDIGWWLSFLAFFGVLILAPAIVSLIYRKRENKEPGIIFGIIIESFSAQVVTAPLIAHVFGTFSVISLASNVLVLPWIPLVMLLVFIVGIAGIFSPATGLILGTLPKVILSPVILIIEKLASLSFASAQLKFSQLGMILCYTAILAFITLTNKKLQRAAKGLSQDPG
jgi:competence protein ComEC